jgi:hypothetical protein
MADMTVAYDLGKYAIRGSFAMANSQAQDTAIPLDVPLELLPYTTTTFRATVYNPGAVAVTVRFLVAELLGGSLRYIEVDNLTVTAANTGSKGITGLTQGGDARVTVENDTAVGGSGAFTASVVLRALA